MKREFFIQSYLERIYPRPTRTEAIMMWEEFKGDYLSLERLLRRATGG
jgi:hypothetical protein